MADRILPIHDEFHVQELANRNCIGYFIGYTLHNIVFQLVQAPFNRGDSQGIEDTYAHLRFNTVRAF